MFINAQRRHPLWLYFISTHAINLKNLFIRAEFQNFNFSIHLSSSSDCKNKCSFVQFGHCLTFRVSLDASWCYMTDWRLLIACQASCSLATILLECLLECLSHLVSALQVAWFFVSKPQPYTAKVFILSLNISINLNKVQAPLACVWPRVVVQSLRRWPAR